MLWKIYRRVIQASQKNYQQFESGKLVERKLNIQYTGIHFLISALSAASLAYASVFMLGKGLESSMIGVILAVSSLLSIVIQTGYANYVDRHPLLSLQGIMIMTNLLVIVLSIVLYFAQSEGLIILAVILTYSFLRTNQAMSNSLAFIYRKFGVHINYGFARAMGSLSYAVITVVIGQIIARTDSNQLPLFYILFSFLLVLAVYSYQLETDYQVSYQSGQRHQRKDKKKEKDSLTFREFIPRYRKFVNLVGGVILLFFTHSLVSLFLIQIITPVGGNSASMGIAIFIAAAIEVPVMMNFERLLDYKPVEYWLKISAVFFVIKNIVIYFAPNMQVVYFSQTLQMGAYALAYPALVHYVDKVIDLEDLVKGQSLIVTGMSIGAVLSSFLGGFMIDYLEVSLTLFIGIFVTIFGAYLVFRSVEETV